MKNRLQKFYICENLHYIDHYISILFNDFQRQTILAYISMHANYVLESLWHD